MTVTHTSRKGVTYYLCQGVTKTGKPRYYFAREPKEKPVNKIPEGYEIIESVNAIVSLAKKRPQLILPEEVASVEAALQQHPKSKHYRVAVKDKRIDIYEQVGIDGETLASRFIKAGLVGPENEMRLQSFIEKHDQHAQFSAVMRFILADKDRRIFNTQRMCYLGSIDDWIHIGRPGSIDRLARTMIPKLGTDAFFELY